MAIQRRHQLTIDLWLDEIWLHTQPYLEAESDTQGSQPAYTPHANYDRVGVAPGLIRIVTLPQHNGVPVVLERHDLRPDLSLDAWDHVVACSISLPTGCLYIYSPEWFPIEPPYILPIPPDTYRVLVCYGNLASGRLAGQAADHYAIFLWPGAIIAPQVLKRYG